MVRYPGVCCHDRETTVFAHIGGAGMATKQSDFLGAYACRDCHAAYDGHLKTNISQRDLSLWFYEGVFRTQEKLIAKKLIQLGN